MEITKTTPEKQAMELGKVCIKCGQCCEHTGGILIGDEDLKKLAKHLNRTPEETKEKFLEEVEWFGERRLKTKTAVNPNGSRGACVFLGENKECTVHEAKPTQCRVCTGPGRNAGELFSWFLLNYCIDPKNPDSMRQYAHYLRAGGKTIPGGELNDLVKDKEKLKKILNNEIIYRED